LLKWYDKSYCLESVKQNGNALQYVNQTDEICLAALNQNPESIQYIDVLKHPKLYENLIK